MPLKKKKGKASKFARMTDEERARYLQHRAELELETKRRKQQLIAAYSKLKFSREEVFSRINNAKINEQWRTLLRKIKTRELYDSANYMRDTFNKAINDKDTTIQKLFKQLELANLDHNRLQKAHMVAIDILIDKCKERLLFFKNNYSREVDERKSLDLPDINATKKEMEESTNHLKTLNSLQEIKIDKLISKTKIENAIKTLTLKFSCQDEMSNLNFEMGSKIKEIWLKIEQTINDYEINTENKRKKYEQMKEIDDKCRLEIAQFPEIQRQLQNKLEKLRNEHELLIVEKNRISKENENHIQLLNDRVKSLRHEIKTSQEMDSTKLKHLIVASNKTIEELSTTAEKGKRLRMLMNLCSELESSLNIKRIQDNDQDITSQAYDSNKSPDIISKFWDQFNHVSAENVLLSRKRNRLAAENTRLKQALKCYFSTIRNAPSINKCG